LENKLFKTQTELIGSETCFSVTYTNTWERYGMQYISNDVKFC